MQPLDSPREVTWKGTGPWKRVPSSFASMPWPEIISPNANQEVTGSKQDIR